MLALSWPWYAGVFVAAVDAILPDSPHFVQISVDSAQAGADLAVYGWNLTGKRTAA